ncbi:MAG: homoserine kinase [Cellulomonadaceae bacterium]
MQLGADHVRVTVPATSANLGPGFDSLGLALGLHDEIDVRAVGAAQVTVEVSGEGAEDVPRDESHLVVRALQAGLEAAGAPLTGLELRCVNRVPHGRGLGSSAAAVVGGLFAARGLIADPAALDDVTLLALATELEGHPDNAAPAILGGATIAWVGAAGPRATRVEVHPDVEPWVLVPSSTLPTRTARGVLPGHVPHADAAFTAGRAALLIHALTRDPDLLFEGTEDRLHQDYRAQVLAGSYELVRALRAEGLAATVSGAGPSVLVLARGADGDLVRETLTALIAGSRQWRVLLPGVDTRGASVRREPAGV